MSIGQEAPGSHYSRGGCCRSSADSVACGAPPASTAKKRGTFGGDWRPGGRGTGVRIFSPPLALGGEEARAERRQNFGILQKAFSSDQSRDSSKSSYCFNRPPCDTIPPSSSSSSSSSCSSSSWYSGPRRLGVRSPILLNMAPTMTPLHASNAQRHQRCRSSRMMSLPRNPRRSTLCPTTAPANGRHQLGQVSKQVPRFHDSRFCSRQITRPQINRRSKMGAPMQI